MLDDKDFWMLIKMRTKSDGIQPNRQGFHKGSTDNLDPSFSPLGQVYIQPTGGFSADNRPGTSGVQQQERLNFTTFIAEGSRNQYRIMFDGDL